MNADLSSFCELLREHVTRPRHFGSLEAPTGRGHVSYENGDDLRLWVRVENGRLAQVSWRCPRSRVLSGVASYVCQRVFGEKLETAAALRVEEVEAALQLPAEFRYCAFVALLALLDAIGDDRWKLRGEKS